MLGSTKTCSSYDNFPFHDLHELDGLAQLNQRMCHDRKKQDLSVVFRRWFSFTGFHWILSSALNEWFCRCIWNCWNEIQHFQNCSTPPFAKSCLMSFAYRWSIIWTIWSSSSILGSRSRVKTERKINCLIWQNKCCDGSYRKRQNFWCFNRNLFPSSPIVMSRASKLVK